MEARPGPRLVQPVQRLGVDEVRPRRRGVVDGNRAQVVPGAGAVVDAAGPDALALPDGWVCFGAVLRGVGDGALVEGDLGVEVVREGGGVGGGCVEIWGGGAMSG